MSVVEPDPPAARGLLTEGGPHVVAIGGGHGQAATLRAARRFAGSITAVVSVADDGGSSGRLRRQLGVVPPGDLRMCLVALGDPGSLLLQAFEHRFEAESPDLVGHPLGNLVLAGLAGVCESIDEALAEAGHLLGAVGRVYSASTEPVDLKAEAASGEISGQSKVTKTPSILRVSLVPPDVPSSPGAVEAILAADQVILGPGSLYTSVLAAATVNGIRDALASTTAQRVYVANLHPQEAETDGYDVTAHVRALRRHGIEVDVVLADSSGIAIGEVECRVVDVALSRNHGLVHDPVRLAQALADLVG